MDINKLVIHNLYCFKDVVVHFNNNGVYFIYGINVQTKSTNAIGKTAIPEAIKYVLFNKLRVESPDKAVRFGTNNMYVEIEFLVNKHNYFIRRERKKNKKSNVVLKMDGVKINKQTPTATNKMIVEILGIDYDQFMHSFNYSQSDFDNLKNFTASKLIGFLKSALKLDRFDNYKNKAKEELILVEEKLNKILGVQETLKNLPSINVNKKELKKSLEELEKKVKKIDDKLKLLDSEIEECNYKLTSSREEFAKITENKRRVDGQLRFINKNDRCPTCKQRLKNSKVESECKERLEKLEININDLYQNIKEYEDELFKYNSDQDNVEDMRDRVNEEILKIGYQLETLDKYRGLNKDKANKIYKKLINDKVQLEKVVEIFNDKGLPLYILNYYIPKLEIIMNSVLSELTDFSIRIETEARLKLSDKLVDTCKIVLYKCNNVYSLSNLSGAETVLINLAFRIGVSKIFLTSSRFETLIIDEAFGKLGEVNRDKVTLLLNRLKKIFHKILIISHIESIRLNFEDVNRIYIEKDGNISRLVYNNNERW